MEQCGCTEYSLCKIKRRLYNYGACRLGMVLVQMGIIACFKITHFVLLGPHRIRWVEASMQLKLLLGNWPILTCGTVSCRRERFTTWPPATAERKWAASLRGRRPALRYSVEQRNGHLSPVVNSTELHYGKQKKASTRYVFLSLSFLSSF